MRKYIFLGLGATKLQTTMYVHSEHAIRKFQEGGDYNKIPIWLTTVQIVLPINNII